MTAIPKEFSHLRSYYNCGKTIEDISPTVSIVFYHVFIDYCKDILPTLNSQECNDFVEQFSGSLPIFPEDGPDEVRFVADELYEVLAEKYLSGKVYLKMPSHFYYCSMLYSIISGVVPEIREKRCRHVAARLLKWLKTTKAFEKVEKSIRKKHKLAKKEAPKPVETTSEEPLPVPEEPLSVLEPVHIVPEPIPETLNQPPILPLDYNKEDLINYFSYYGIPLPKSVAVPHNQKSDVMRYLDLGLNCLKLGNRDQGKVFLSLALSSWYK